MNSKSLAERKDRDADKIKGAVLGKDYELSLVFCTDSLSRKLNRIYRSKDKPTNVLAFPLSENSGEIFINTKRLGKFTALELYIHALLHLKGMRHGAKMEHEEKRFLKLFNGTTSFGRDRRRHAPSKGSHRRRSS
jgi:ssRNA-specific RNase YbeY (16S rRNA maturation enzyme)